MIIILKPNKFYSPSNHRRERYNTPAEKGDYTIEIPSLEFGEEGYASLNIVGRQLHDDEGLHFGNIELVGLKVICKRGEPLYHGLPEPKTYEYIMTLYLYDVNGEWQTYNLHGTDISFLLYTILPLINLTLRDGCLISQLNFDWLEWQCNAWEWGEANGQGRGFLFKEDDIYDFESLYRYLKSFKIEAIKQSVYRRGGGVYWTDVYICFRCIDNYISNLISDALGVKFIISGDTTKVISYKLELDKYECDGYCPNNSSILSNNEAEKYREQIEMKLLIHVLRAFDLIELKKESAYQVIFCLEFSPARNIDIKIQRTEFMDFVGSDIRNKIKELGKLWKSSENQLTVSIDILTSWDTLISEWAKDESMPLIIRKGSSRGQEFTHPSGRKVIISDNTFALWVYRNVLDGKTYNLLELRNKLNNNEIPMVYALTKEDKKKAKYTKTLGKDALSANDAKWKLCHIEPVGMNSRKNIMDLDINKIVMYFKRYANPMNMFILPKEIGGLGEIQEFIDEQRY